MALTVLGFLMDKLRVTASKVIIWNIRIDTRFIEVLHITFIGKARIRGNDNLAVVNVFTNP